MASFLIDKGAGSLPVDAAEAMRHFKTAAELGNVEAQYKLGQLYMGDFDEFGAGGPAGSVSAKEVRRLELLCGDA